MEQPIYWPDANGTRYERAWQSIQRRDGGAAHPANDLRAIFGLDDRVAAYQYRPRDCVNSIRWSAEAGAQVSFSGGLIENIQSFAETGGQLGYGTNWHGGWRQARNWYTASSGTNVPRMDIVQFSFHHALLPLVDDTTIRKELALLYADVERLGTRVENLDRHFGQAVKDVEEIKISTEKATKRARRLDNFDFEELGTPGTPLIGPQAAE
jgi:hypothetical protein